MSDLEIVELDPFDAAAFDAWHRVYAEAELACGPGVAAPWQLEELRVLLQTPSDRYAKAGWSGLVDGRVVTVGFLRVPLRDNPDRAEVAVHTLPAARRRGYGAAMLARLEQVARERGRAILVGEIAWPYAAGPDGTGEPGPGFAAAHGYGLALGDVKRRLRLPVAAEVLDALAAEAAAASEGFTLRSFVGAVPEEILAGWTHLVSSLVTEAPTGDLEVEPEAADPALVRETEALIEKQGRTKYNTVALDPAGEVVAYTDLATTIHEPGRAYQWGTLVRADARGHRLGIAVKVANLRLLQDARPDVTTLVTYNAEVNARMVEVNERLGFTPVARLGEFQKRA
ncbi:GNAT family N-acetyltransferase [Nocardioides sp. MAH-18]|uniref:GNAT family N-acetyltransferase n=1 Tax=Nocardioides agri TaxID=2682843 RepID=A0A6L6XQ57_9ACTN|nr:MULTISPECIES: GNAT family N-acetyltransferase [unclassified Nocardioides]MBA2954287.1 GNAT family N-acetyltransferase [Nocardioides sp. CGMCC 1.13656]MVQ49148.1 GNAT family N-acetyltransferase [Nocardioides sp. MAH-18]